MCSKVLNGHIILTDTSITTILAPEMTYTPEKMIGGDADVRHKSANKVIKILFAFLSDILYICIELFDRMNLDVSLFETYVSKSLPHKKTTL